MARAQAAADVLQSGVHGDTLEQVIVQWRPDDLGSGSVADRREPGAHLEQAVRNGQRAKGQTSAVTPPRENLFDLEAHRPRYFMARIRAALSGRFDAALLSNDEERVFYDLPGEAMRAIETRAARAFWANFDKQTNTDISS